MSSHQMNSREEAEPRTIDAAGVRDLDRHLIEEIGIPGIVLMEHAALGVAEVVLKLAAGHDRDRVVVLCGAGNNGGDGWAVARLLHEDLRVLVVSTGLPRTGSDAHINAMATRRLGIETVGVDRVETLGPELDGAIVVDALFGIGLDRPIEGLVANLVGMVGRSSSLVVAVDLPSGMDSSTGRPLGPCIHAHVTATMVARKPGLLVPGADLLSGEVVVVDIGAPRAEVDRFTAVARSAGTGDDVLS
ncbi:MAG: NAD(P)H-hydrate epimerase [Phycisphaera sp.]|nr:NAD(P)H-hydrate epimerase [Phycisphaera sp.]